MLDQNIIDQLHGIFAKLAAPVTLEVTGVASRVDMEQMTEFARDFASSSDKIDVAVVATSEAKAPVMSIIHNGKPTGISFEGIPNGHEFTSLILAVLNSDGQGKNLPDPALLRRIASIKGPVEIMTIVSLTCTNCPEVVQALNIVALYNPSITHSTVDGAVAQRLVEDLGVQSVPTVFANGRMISVGRSDLGELVTRLESEFGTVMADEAADTPSEPLRFDAVVAGGGPAGAAAAIYLARKGMKTAVVAGRIGGQVKDTMDIENLISVPLTTGPALASDIRRHLERYPDITIFDNRRVAEISLVASVKTLTTDGGERFEAPAVVIATGASWRRLNVAGEADYLGRGVAFCTHCDGPFYAGKRVAVIGGGNSGIEAAIDLAGIATHVDVFEFLDTLKADGVLVDKLAGLANVDIHLSTAVTEVIGDGRRVTALKAKDRNSEIETTYDVDGIFVQIGLTPNSKPFDGEVPVNSRGEIETDQYGRTSLTGVYAAGDVTDVPYKQIVIAMGEGAKAALSVFEDRMRGVI
ncbi:MAG: alkyl hydroperoxide reductase subunit F [Clostridium sp.]|nr:alkyl hydroperoxide reductase subunit F [Clostridium sp.]